MPSVEYARWLLWSALSSCEPFQQFGKLTTSLRLGVAQVGISAEARTSRLPPQLQYVILEP
jgi:hypothetical protein